MKNCDDGINLIKEKMVDDIDHFFEDCPIVELVDYLTDIINNEIATTANEIIMTSNVYYVAKMIKLFCYLNSHIQSLKKIN